MQPVSVPYLSRNDKRYRLAPLLQMPWSMLLDSAGSNLDYNRFDIFCFAPSVSLTFDGKQNTLRKMPANEATTNKNEPLKLMREILEQYLSKDNSQALQAEKRELPFKGGWLGYISYDFARQLENLPNLAEDDIQLPQLQMGLYQWALITDHKQGTSKIYNFGLEAPVFKEIVKQLSECLDGSLNYTAEAFKLTSNWQSNTSEASYYKAFNQVKDYILAGDCYQVNLAQQFSATFTGSPLAAYQQLAESNQAPFSAYFNFTDHQILCVSPERFIESHQGKVTTQPIKGTRPRSSNKAEDTRLAEELIDSEKDRAENLMIVDLLRNDLSRTAAKGSVKVTELFGHYRFESVHHLISTIESELAAGLDNFDILATSLPGGSITGAPKIRAMEIIEELEPVRRNLYCGVIGYLDFAGNMDTNICIRTLISKNHKLYCWAGGGLVADSEAKIEYQETFDKLAKILPVLASNTSIN